MTDKSLTLPAIALRGTTILPDMIVHFDVSRKRSIKAIEASMLDDQRIFLVTQKNPDMEDPSLADLYQNGTVAYIKQVIKLAQGQIRVLVEGSHKARLLTFIMEEPYLQALVKETEPDDIASYSLPVIEAMKRTIRDLFQEYSAQGVKISKDLVNQITSRENLQELMENVAINLPLSYTDRQRFLDADTIQEQFELLGMFLKNEVQVMGIRRDLQMKIKQRVDKNQKDYVLREQMKVIREELGEDPAENETEEFRRQLEELDAPEEVKKRIGKEISRLESLGNNSGEANVSRTYIETLLTVPWNAVSKDNEDLKAAGRILEEDHYGLQDVKERIMEFLSVRKLTGMGKSPILCLAGPPGTGKTSIAKSIARALDKKYIRICLGGIRDEAEIRGHRRTYIGALPGNISDGLIRAGVRNPLMLLDEIDKTSSDYKGDTSSALLEVLDPEQNSHFKDHYLDIPQDLSEVLFIATANDVQNIPRPLLDRMELIEISGYTENEKEHIAKEHLIPKQLEENGIPKGTLVIRSAAVREIINHYTKEAGVRQLERCIGKICRKAARQIVEGSKKKITVTEKNLAAFLGKEKFNYLMANKKDEVGIARGLAWTQVGGDTLEIEVNIMPGKGELLLTGQLGDVMKESAQAGISYIRSVSEEHEIPQEFFQEHDIHVHIPEGAVPKDGPSAGITMATAMFSAICGKPVRADIAMTGEITLRGHVLPIGGLKEKLLAAKYAGIKEVLVPEKNQPDVEEMDHEITDGLVITFVESMQEVLSRALVQG